MQPDLSLSQEIGVLLREKGLFLVTAESCSGGLLGHLITSVAGSSDYYLGGVVAYSNLAKRSWLHVQATTLQQFGAVSQETVLEMVAGARAALGANTPVAMVIGLAISGIAGPGGGTPQKPVGNVWIGLGSARGQEAHMYQFSGDRLAVMQQAAHAALGLLKAHLRRARLA